MTESANKKYAIIEFDIDSCRLGYFDDKKDILFNSDIYWFPARANMTDEQYEEYVFTLKDLIQHYEFVLVCTHRAIIKFTDSFEFPEIVCSRSTVGDVRYGIKDTVIINNPYYKRYVAQPDGENGPTYIAENGEVEVIYPDL